MKECEKSEEINELLQKIGDNIWQLQADGYYINYNDEALKAATKLFVDTMLCFMFKNSLKTQGSAAELGGEIRDLIKKYTGQDSFNFYK